MGLFKKKQKDEIVQEPVRTDGAQQHQAVKAFADQFLADEVHLLAVTGPSGISYTQDEQSGLWHVCFGLTAWMDKYATEIELGNARLEAMLDDDLLEFLLGRIPRNFVISVTARPSLDGNRFLMTDLPAPAFDPDLHTIAQQQKQPVSIDVEELGKFTLNRSLGWYEAGVDWCGREVSLTFDQAQDSLAAAQDTARALMREKEQWDTRIRQFAADELLSRARSFPEADEYLSREDFIALMECDSILSAPDGAFEFWFGGEDLLMLHPVHVTGTLNDGPTFAEIEE